MPIHRDCDPRQTCLRAREGAKNALKTFCLSRTFVESLTACVSHMPRLVSRAGANPLDAPPPLHQVFQKVLVAFAQRLSAKIPSPPSAVKLSDSDEKMVRFTGLGLGLRLGLGLGLRLGLGKPGAGGRASRGA